MSKIEKCAFIVSIAAILCLATVGGVSLATTGKLPVISSAPAPIELEKTEALALINAEYQAAIAQAEVQKIRSQIYGKRSLTPDKYTLDVRNGRLVPVPAAPEKK